MINVILPSQLESYTEGLRDITLDLGGDESQSLTLFDVIKALDERFPGLAFRVVDEQKSIRRHIAIFVGETLVRDLQVPLKGGERVHIVGGWSGG